jgi:ribosomal subunit interface protein
MKIQIGSRKVILREAMKTALRTQLLERIRRFAASIVSVRVELSDRNGRRGGGDKRCRIQVFLAEGRRIVQDDMRADVWNACQRAMDRLESALRRELRTASLA